MTSLFSTDSLSGINNEQLFPAIDCDDSQRLAGLFDLADLFVLPALSSASSANLYAGRNVCEVAEGELSTRREGFGLVLAIPSREVYLNKKETGNY